MVIARISNESKPTTCGGSKTSGLSKNPVALVATVVTRNTPVHTRGMRAFHILFRTTKPAAMPIKLIATCNSVSIRIAKSRLIFQLSLYATLKECRVLTACQNPQCSIDPKDQSSASPAQSSDEVYLI